MNAVFQQPRAQPRDSALSDGASASSLEAGFRAWRRRAGSLMMRLRLQLAGAAAGSRLLSSKSAFFVAGERMLGEAHRAGRAISLAVFEFDDLRELGGIYGSTVKRAVMVQVVARMARAAGAHGLLARTGPTHFTMLMPGADRKKALQAVHRAMGDPVRIEIESDDHEIVLVPEFQIERVDTEMASVEALYRELCLDIQDARRQKQDREHYLTRERERHSRPLSVGLRPAHPDGHGHGGGDIPTAGPDS